MDAKNPLAGIPKDVPVDLVPPDISAYAEGSHGVPYVWTFHGDAPGPHVALSAVVHGNEPCGAIALDALLKVGTRPARGSLSFVFVNIAAYQAFDPDHPYAARWVDEDFNRLCSEQTLNSERTSSELERARELRPFIDTIDLLLDIHSMQDRCAPLLLAGPAEKGQAFAGRIGVPEIVVVDAGHAAGPRLRDYGAFISPASSKNAVLVECGQHWEAGAADVAIDTAVHFLRATGAVEPDFFGERVGAANKPQRVIEITDRITVKTDDFAFTQTFHGLDEVAKAGTVFAEDGGEPLRTPYDDCVFIMPSKRLWAGQTAVRLGRFIRP